MGQENRVGIVTKLQGRASALRCAAPVDPGGVSWVCAVARSGAEFAVADDLQAVGFRTFAPHAVVAYVPRLYNGKRARRLRAVPVFAPYVFVGQPVGLLLAKRSHPHLLDVLSNDCGPLRVPPAFIEAASDLWLAGEWDERARRAKRKARFAKGDAVRLRGPFEGLRAVVSGLPTQDRACVEIVMFGAPRRATVDTHDLELV